SAQQTSLVSNKADGKQADRDCVPAAISQDGNTVAFVSDATTLAGLTTHFMQCYVKDRATGALELASRNDAGSEANPDVPHARPPTAPASGSRRPPPTSTRPTPTGAPTATSSTARRRRSSG